MTEIQAIDHKIVNKNYQILFGFGPRDLFLCKDKVLLLHGKKKNSY